MRLNLLHVSSQPNDWCSAWRTGQEGSGLYCAQADMADTSLTQCLDPKMCPLGRAHTKVMISYLPLSFLTLCGGILLKKKPGEQAREWSLVLKIGTAIESTTISWHFWNTG